MIKIDSKDYVQILKVPLQDGKEVSLKISGNSMQPFLANNRDIVFLKNKNSPYKKGDIILFERESGQPVLHRICRIYDENIYVSGDVQTFLEGPIKKSSIIGTVFKIERKGKMILPNNFIWKFFSGFWVFIFPLRKPLFFLYRKFSKLKHKIIKK